MSNGFLNIPFWMWGVVALIIAGIFAVFVPKAALVKQATGMQFIILRWFHSLVWLLLGGSFLLRGTGLASLADPLAALGGLTYLIFMMTTMQFLSQSRQKNRDQAR